MFPQGNAQCEISCILCVVCCADTRLKGTNDETRPFICAVCLVIPHRPNYITVHDVAYHIT